MTTDAKPQSRGRYPWSATAVVVGGSGVAMIAGLAFAGSAWSTPIAGLPDAGALVGWGLPILRLAVLLLSVLTVAGLLHAAVLAPQGRNGVVSPAGRQALVRASWAAIAWCVSSVALALFTLSSILALPLGDTIAPSVLKTYALELPITRVPVLVGALALLIAMGTLLTATVSAALGWLAIALIAVALPALTGHAAGLGDHALAITSGLLHQMAAVLWCAGVVAIIGAAWRREPALSSITARFGTLATWSVAVLALSGVLASMTRLDSPTQLLSTSYGLLITAKILMLVGALVVATRIRRRLVGAMESTPGKSSSSALRRLLLLEVGLLAIALGLAVSLARTAPPRIPIELPTFGEQLIGYPYPAAPTLASVAFGWHPDAFFLVVALLIGGLYVAAVMRLRSRGDHWPALRTVSWLCGVAVMVWATNSGLAAYSPISFGLHMLQHMTLSMLAPILLVLGGPFTLALRAMKPRTDGTTGPREFLVWGLHSWIAKIYTNPLVVLFIYTVGLYGLYYTPLFGTLMSTHVGHVLMSVHFMVAGYLFYWVIIGIDPVPKPLPYWGKLLLLLVSMVIHAFFAVPIMSASIPIAAEWFAQVKPPWITSLLADTHLAGGIAWGFGEIPALVVLVALSVQWARDDTKKARRRDRQVDRHGDRELDDYNAHLARLSAADAAREARDTR